MGALKNFKKHPKFAIFLILVVVSIFMNVVLGVAPPGTGTGPGP